MNKSKIIGAATGIATLLSATAATADGVNINGYIEGWFTSGDNTIGTSNTIKSSTVLVSYATTLDNGMGLSIGYEITDALSGGFSLDTGMGTIATGSGGMIKSAADAMDSLPNNSNPQSSNKKLGSYNDGDDNSGENILYTSPSINGWKIAASVGENTSNADRVKSLAIKGKVAGLSIAAGAVDTGGTYDDTFVTLGYKVAGVSLGYGNYDSDEDTSTAISVKTNVAGMTVGFRYDELDATTDNSMNTYSIGKDFGGMSMTLMYEDQDAADNSEWNLQYAMGF
ncbi:porin [Pelagibacteraceae bacterium]|nr:porin [Pelagibacteraceae bacterium]